MSLIAYYKLNGDATDASGNDHHGTPTDVSWVAGKIGLAASFNGSSGRIALPSALPAALGGCGGVTVSAWVKRAGTGTLQCVLGLTITSGANKLFLGINASNKIYVGARSTSSESFQTVAAVASFTDTAAWHHLATTVDLATNAILIYLDGEPNSTTGSPSFAQTTFSAEAASGNGIGTTLTSHFFNGQIDDVRIYDVALPAWMVRAIAEDRSGALEPWARTVVPVVNRLIVPMRGAAA